MSKRAAIYVRISSDPEGKKLGIKRQEEDCRELAARLGATDITVYPDNDRSASTRTRKKREQFDAMIKAAEAGQFDFILAYSNSRLTRRPLEAERLIQLYETHGVLIKTVVSGEDDLSTADGRMTARIRASIDAAEAERAAERVARAAKQRAQQGRSNGGTRPYGWSAEDRTKLDPREHAVIVEMADRVLAGEPLRSVAADLNRREIPTVKGAPWSPTAIRGILVNPRLVSIRVHKHDEVGPGDWEPALPRETYDRLRDLLLDEKRRIAMSNKVRNLLTGIALCGECGDPVAAKVQVRGDERRKRYYCAVCNLYRTQEPIDVMVEAAIVEYLRTLGPEPARGTDPQVVKRIGALERKIRETQAAFAADDLMTADDLLETLRPLKEQLRFEQRKVKPEPRSSYVTDAAGPDAQARWDAQPLGIKRLIISEMIEVRIQRGIRGKRGFDPSRVEIVRR
jgi:DNA invertase Pin-like site-specific DNA recombinase